MALVDASIATVVYIQHLLARVELCEVVMLKEGLESGSRSHGNGKWVCETQAPVFAPVTKPRFDPSSFPVRRSTPALASLMTSPILLERILPASSVACNLVVHAE
jgi:hypothetical protein